MIHFPPSFRSQIVLCLVLLAHPESTMVVVMRCTVDGIQTAADPYCPNAIIVWWIRERLQCSPDMVGRRRRRERRIRVCYVE